MDKQSGLGYFKAIKKHKASYWADFLMKTTPLNRWIAKQFVAPRMTSKFPPLSGATDLVSINRASLNQCFPPEDPLPPRGRLARDPSAPLLTSDEIKHVLSKSSPSSTPGAGGIPYSIMEKGNPPQPDDPPGPRLAPGSLRVPTPQAERYKWRNPGQSGKSSVGLYSILSHNSRSRNCVTNP